MAWIIGMDEAGYGPNLGPLVITATAWQVPGDPHGCDLWREFRGLIKQTPAAENSHIQVADSKQVYAPARGLTNLEQGVLCALNLIGQAPTTFRQLWDHVGGTAAERDGEPWFKDNDVGLPHAADMDGIAPLLERWKQRCDKRGIRLSAVSCEVVMAGRFNELTRQHDSKGRALSQLSMDVIRRLWPEDDEPTLILADKHGGRNNYHEFLQMAAGDRFIMCQQEGRDCSRYKIKNTTVRFETKAERHFPVALASMVSKYVRELGMILFNRFWTSHIPDLKPTAGYPGDAQRYWDAIAPVQRKLGIPDDTLWRER